ncbi:phage/plasmid primase, P4 family [Staphylococcus haemolyticus]|uniref:phage/plasmid primase, P4 family n=1 Tax=Staphylococcus haemolyticus TaxID=1283 RepID=UPI0028A50C73|nr:phage/plasmid primase, P4 family [Staphylococcus haemolyticus]MDT4239048.1 phage/plasmid primase, P4 family [Staphylococcus haemolyticus]MDT4297857.1 phage/plasmid primase, P4 family [Staphylococcus haemolyticus]MDT4300241.1 phage/plasmid primase, P4 family [Staphylococcus haemolyticus]MDT4312494.1 phage/plasmid primase, P4 family [Staphylococcus haemolyticus]MDT4316979.1 phage/plasmid primase, P4 family [Staphylococcus haemolyticus]
MMNILSNIPDELKQLNNWCVWKFEKCNGKRTKIPFNAETGEFAKSNDKSTWSSYETAVNAQGVDGIGFFFEPPYLGIDIDDIDDDLHRFKQGDKLDNIVSEFNEAFKSYTEVSPSGNGLHIIVKGKIPGTRRRKGNIEMYDSGRFFTMTGKSIGKYKDVTEVSKQVFKTIYDKYLPDNTVQYPTTNNYQQNIHNLSEIDVINEIYKSKQAKLFDDLMKGNYEPYYTSHSEADMALANILAFWCAKDYSQMDSIFRQSNLYRDKWDEKRKNSTYGEQTLFKAINEANNIYTPKQQTDDNPLRYALSRLFDNQEETKEFPIRSYDDTGNADRFIDRYGHLYKHSYITNKFYIYDGQKWKVDDRGAIRKLIDEMIENIKNEKVLHSEDVTEEEAREAFQKYYKKTRGTQSKKNIMNELMHRKTVTPDEFDNDDMLLNVANGYVDLTSRELYKHDINRMFSQIANTDYSEKMQPSVWLDFLNDIFAGDKEVIRYIQKALGYSLTGSTREQIMFILFGKGRNGKSIFVETIAEILGDYSNNMQAKSLMVQKNDNVNTDIARLSKARFVTSSEPNEGFRFDEGLIKQLTGGDKVTARFLYAEEFEYTPKFKIWVSTNHKPIIRGTDDGIWRRLVLIPFDVQIPEEKVDKDLKYKLLREAPAILNWMAEGAYMWMREGLELPDKLKDAGQTYRTEMDVVEQFIQEKCKRAEDVRETGKALYEEYKKWADENNEYKMDKNKFGKKLKEKFRSKKMNNGVNYLGVELTEKYPGLRGLN